MSDDKKDLTRIEDIGEFLHQLNEPDNYLPDLPEEAFEASSSEETLPDLPFESISEEENDSPPAFGSDFSEPTEQEASFEPSTEFGSIESEDPFAQDPFPASTDTEEPQVETEADPFSSEPSFDEPEENDSVEFGSQEDSMEFDSSETEVETELEAEPEIEDPFEAEEAIEDNNLKDVHESGHVFEAQDDYESISAPPIEEPKPVQEEFTKKEDFSDMKSFSEKAVLSDVAAECNPPFSVIARQIRFLEDSDDILILLKETGFPEDMMDQFKKQIERGTLLIPRVSEFTAIYLCHKLRRLKLELTMGLSDVLHPPKNSQDNDKGLVSRRSLGQNQHHKFEFKTDTADAKNIILSTLSSLDTHSIERYLGVASEHTFLESHVIESETTEIIHQNYDELAQKLKRPCSSS
jgi:hypothetical protein